MKSFHQVMLDLIKRDTLTMEVSAYNDPWFPDPSVVIDAFKTYTTMAFDFWGDECFFACLNYVDATEPLLFCFSDSKGDVRESFPSTPVAPDSLIKWLYEHLEEVMNGRSSYFASEAMSLWLKDKYNPQLIVAPYIVQRSPVVETILKSVRDSADAEHAAELVHKKMQGDVDGFLYTRTSLFPKGVKHFSEAYYSAALVVGVDLGRPASEDVASQMYRDLYEMSETLSIKFQMSWGYPQLLKEKERMGKEKALHEQAKVELDRYKKASDIAKQLAAALGPAYETVSQLNRMLKPLPSALLTNYQRVTPYIPQDDKVRVFDKWIFMHDWKVDEIKQDTESFRAQIACILLAYIGDSIPSPDATSWKLDSPWQRLLNRRSELDLVTRLLPKLTNTLSRLLDDGESSGWCSEDVSVFRDLKACFYYPFKTKSAEGIPIPDRLTGPLFTLWVLENGGHIDDESRRRFFSEKAKSGDGWPNLKILPAIYALTDLCDYKEVCELFATAELDSSINFTGVRIDMPVADDEKLASLCKAITDFQAVNNEEGELLGNFLSAVRSIQSVQGSVIPSERVRGLEVTFPIK